MLMYQYKYDLFSTSSWIYNDIFQNYFWGQSKVPKVLLILAVYSRPHCDLTHLCFSYFAWIYFLDKLEIIRFCRYMSSHKKE